MCAFVLYNVIKLCKVYKKMSFALRKWRFEISDIHGYKDNKCAGTFCTIFKMCVFD